MLSGWTPPRARDPASWYACSSFDGYLRFPETVISFEKFWLSLSCFVHWGLAVIPLLFCLLFAAFFQVQWQSWVGKEWQHSFPLLTYPTMRSTVRKISGASYTKSINYLGKFFVDLTHEISRASWDIIFFLQSSIQFFLVWCHYFTCFKYYFPTSACFRVLQFESIPTIRNCAQKKQPFSFLAIYLPVLNGVNFHQFYRFSNRMGNNALVRKINLLLTQNQPPILVLSEMTAQPA